MDRRELNLSNRMERLPMTGFQRKMFYIICTAWLFDSMDLAMMTFIMAPVSTYFGLSSHQTGFLGATSLAGMGLGAVMAGMLADRFGRKVVFQWSILGWGVASLLCAVSWNFYSLLAFRFLLGFFMGSEFPVAQAMVSEIIPTAKRGKYIALLEGFFPLGFILAGVVAYILLPLGGWRLVFIAEGLPAIIVLYIRRVVPESARWLEDKGHYNEADQVVTFFEKGVEKKLGQALPAPAMPVECLSEAPSDAFALRELFRGVYLKRTMMAWLLWFFAMLAYYGITTWMGKFLVDQGLEVNKSVGYVILMSLWGIPGFFSAAILVEKLGRKPSSVLYILLSGISCYLYSLSADSTDLLVRGALMQFSMFGMWSCLYAYTPELFPTRARATGCGTASTMGRVGAFLGPLLIPFILGHYGGGQDAVVMVFTFGGISFLCAALSIIILGPETKGLSLEEISG